ncbi:hypothetical protein [Shewanella japonica]|uniref:DUF4149 domain-containing protein n=1 Tax=Shewanella japonica TaxID=93973 RepID=A0ABM6JKK6_9GAMM|nr:hypothetical protein [Shewanella japonica]ARD21768.1 hypothetical protein SJ2017_1444 [Shewanella japonica]
MSAIKGLLYIAASVVVLYPLWGLIQPASYLTEIVEVYPFAGDANEAQVRVAAGLLLLSNTVMGLSLVSIAGLIARPTSIHLLKLSALLLITYPFLLTVVEVFSAKALSSHLEASAVTVEFSAMKLFYVIFGIGLLGVFKTISLNDVTKV